jgi:hypothetical protein
MFGLVEWFRFARIGLTHRHRDIVLVGVDQRLRECPGRDGNRLSVRAGAPSGNVFVDVGLDVGQLEPAILGDGHATSEIA